MSRAPLTLVRSNAGALDVVKAASLLAECKSIDFAKDMHDGARAIETLLRAQGASVEAQNDAAEIALRAGRAVGEFLRVMEKNAGAKGIGKAAKSAVAAGNRTRPTLEDLGVEKTAASRFQQLAKAPKEVFEQHVVSTRNEGQRLTMRGAIAAVSRAPDYDSDEYYTPDEYLEAARAALGGPFDLDVASSSKANETVRAKKYFSKNDSALRPQNEIWRGKRVWFQPPYSVTGAFVERLIWNVELGATVRAAICLLNADTGTSWFQELAGRGPMCLPKGRIAFVRPDGKRLEGNRMSQVFFGVGVELDEAKFRAAFAPFGAAGRLEVA